MNPSGVSQQFLLKLHGRLESLLWDPTDGKIRRFSGFVRNLSWTVCGAWVEPSGVLMKMRSLLHERHAVFRGTSERLGSKMIANKFTYKYWCVRIFNTHTNATEAPFKVKILMGRGWPLQPYVRALPWTPFGWYTSLNCKIVILFINTFIETVKILCTKTLNPDYNRGGRNMT